MSVISGSPRPWPPLSADAGDEELVRRVRRGDQRAFEAVYERYREPLYRYCHSIMRHREDAEEAFQATMLSAYRALSTSAEREIALRPWLYRIAHNACISALRRRPRHEAAELTGFEAASADVGAHTELAEDLRQLRRDLAELPDAQRSALVMRELGGLSHVEIGRALNEDAAAVKQLIYSARSALHDLAQGRELACASVRRTLSDGDGRSLRGRGLRAHLRACAGCRSWQAGLHARPAKLAALAPVLSAAAFAQIFEAITGTAAAAGAAAAAAGAGAAGGGGAIGAGAAMGGGAAAGGAAAAAGAGAGASGGLAVKLAAIGSATLIGGGTAAVPAIESAHRDPAPPVRVQQVPATASTPATVVLTAPPPAAAAASAAPGLERAAAARRAAAERMAERAARGGPALERAASGGPRGAAAGLRPNEPGARAARRDAGARAARAAAPAATAPDRALARMGSATRRAQRAAATPPPSVARPAAPGAAPATAVPERPLASGAERRSRVGAQDPPAPVTPIVPTAPTAPTETAADPGGVEIPVVPTAPAPGIPAPDAVQQPPAVGGAGSGATSRRR